MSYCKISGFSDEIASDIKTQFEVLNKLGIKYFEPRGVNGKNISELSEDEAKALKAEMDKHGIKVSSIGSPIGKIKIKDDFCDHFEVFENVIKVAKILEAKHIRIFSFYHDEQEWLDEERSLVISRLKRLTEVAKENDLILLHENEKGIYGDTAERCKDLMDNLYCDNFKAVFDPANFVQCGEDTKKAYELLNPYIAYMHIKDSNEDGTVVPAGYGKGNVAYIIHSLFEKGYDGFLSLEPHLGSFEGLANLELDDKMENLPEGGEGTFTLAYNALCDIINKPKEAEKVDKVKLGIIGFGNMGTSHAARIFRGDIPGMELAAICDIDEERLKKSKELYPDVATFTDVEEMYKSGLLNSVLVAVPHYDHPKYAMMGFDYGLNVLIEKPAGVYTKQVREMNEAAKKQNKVFGIMYNQRTNPMYKKIKDMVESGQLGHIKRITWIVTNWYRPQSYHDSSAWRSSWEFEGGGTLINQNPHQIDLWQWMFGMPDKIFAKISYGKYYDIEVDDDVCAFFEYDNGTTGQYITSTGEAPGTNRLEVACDWGNLIADANGLTFYRNEMSEREYNKVCTGAFGNLESWECKIPLWGGEGEQHNGILKSFTNAILKGEELLAKGEEGINGLTISNAMHLSSWLGEAVDVKNIDEDKFYDMLQDKTKNSTYKKVVKKQHGDTEGTY